MKRKTNTLTAESHSHAKYLPEIVESQLEVPVPEKEEIKLKMAPDTHNEISNQDNFEWKIEVSQFVEHRRRTKHASIVKEELDKYLKPLIEKHNKDLDSYKNKLKITQEFIDSLHLPPLSEVIKIKFTKIEYPWKVPSELDSLNMIEENKLMFDSLFISDELINYISKYNKCFLPI